MNNLLLLSSPMSRLTLFRRNIVIKRGFQSAASQNNLLYLPGRECIWLPFSMSRRFVWAKKTTGYCINRIRNKVYLYFVTSVIYLQICSITFFVVV